MEPAIAQGLRGVFRPVPVARKNISSPDDDFIILGQLHLNAGDGRSHPPGLDSSRIIQRADRRCFGEPVNLQNGYPEHSEVQLRFQTERCGAADEGFQVLAQHLLTNGWEDEGAGELEPQGIGEFRISFVFIYPDDLSPTVDQLSRTTRLPELFIDSLAHALQQLRYVEKIIRRRNAHLAR